MNAIKELGDLFESYYKICGKLYGNMEILGKPLYDIMSADVEKTYHNESKRLMRQAKIEYEAASYELDCKEDALLPGRCGLFWRKRNEPADIIYREVWSEAQQMFKDRTEALEKLEAVLRAAEEKGRADDEPEEPAQDEQKLCENVEKQEAKQTDKPAETKPQKDEKPKKEQPEQLPGQITLDDVQNVQSGKPDTATNTTLTAEKKQAVKPQTRTESGKAREQNQKEEKISTR